MRTRWQSLEFGVPGTGRKSAYGSCVIQHEIFAISTGLLRCLDVACVPTAGLIAYFARFGFAAIDFQLGLILLLGTGTVANVMNIAGAYNASDLSLWPRQAIKVAGIWGVSIALLLAFAFFVKIADQYSRLWIGYWFLLGAAMSSAGRAGAAAYISHRRKAGSLSIHIAIVGWQPFIEQVVRQIASPSNEIRIVGTFAPRLAAGDSIVADDATVAGLLRLARKTRIDEIIVHLPERRDAEFNAMLRKLGELPVNVHLCPDLSDLSIAPRKLTILHEAFMISVFERPLSGWAAAAKRGEDVVLAGLLLLFAAPIMLLIALLVKLDSRGPALFRQRRFGFNNHAITVLKFRTMQAGGENDPLVPQAQRNDPRVTRIGRFLRRSSLDELPQLINVLKGNMSLVGPRPHAIVHNEHYAAMIDGYLSRHRVKPGITGWAQVHGLRGETATIGAMRERVKHDLYYIENWSLRLDLWILLRTLFVGFHRSAF
jgi:Undecaprenyl-phosphate glucose phosphotransferase